MSMQRRLLRQRLFLPGMRLHQQLLSHHEQLSCWEYIRCVKLHVQRWLLRQWIYVHTVQDM